MATVPQYGQGATTVTPEAVRPPNATPTAFGAQKGLDVERLGVGVQRAAATGSDILVKIQEHQNLQDVLAAEAALKDAMVQHNADITSRLGVNARDVVPDTMKFWEERKKAADEALPNGAAREAFQRLYDNHRAASLSKATQHYATQTRAATNAAAEANIQATTESTIADPASADRGVASIRQTHRATGAMNGLPQEVVDQNIEASLTAMHAGVVKSLVDNNPGAARAYYNKYEGQIAPSKRDAIKDALRAGETKGFAQRHGDEIMAKYPDDPEAQMAAARSATTDPDRRAALESYVRTLHADEVRAKQADQQKAMDDVISSITDPYAANKPRGTFDIPVETWERLSAEHKRFLTDRFAAANTVTRRVDDREYLNNVEELIERGAMTDGRQLIPYEDFFTKETYNRLHKAIASGRKVSKDTLRQTFENRLGKTRAKWIKDPESVARWESFQNYVYDNLEDRVYTAKDLATMADDYFMEIDRPWRFDTTFGEVLNENPDLVERSENTYAAWAGKRADLVSARKQMPKAVQTALSLGLDPDPATIGAILLLMGDNKPVTEETIGIVFQRASGK